MSATVRVRTHAKVNLFLRVVDRRADGYHEVENILHGINLADDLTFTAPEKPGVEVNMALEGINGDIPRPEENLVLIAAAKLMSVGAGRAGMRIDLVKRIPMGAGLGGGSANAAGTLVVLNELWRTGLDNAALLEVAAAVGSDVPYFLIGGTALAKGRGERLNRIAASSGMWLVLGISKRPLRTEEVYEAWDRWRAPSEKTSATIVHALRSGDVEEVASLLHNDLEPPAFHLRPELEAKKRSLSAAGSLGALVSGSGPSVFGLASNEVQARRIAAKVEDDFDAVRVVRSHAQSIERL